jgi:hypothetical protein
MSLMVVNGSEMIRYNPSANAIEAWEWDREDYINTFKDKKRLSPDDYKKGKRLFPK